MHEDNLLTSTKRIGTGLAFVIFPIVFVFAFSVHPGLLHPHLPGPSELILRARSAGQLQFGHALVTLDTALLVVVALHFMKLLNHGSGAWAGFLGGALAIVGSLALAADKGALCLTMSALDELSDAEFTTDARPAGHLFQERLVGLALGHIAVASRVWNSSHSLAQKQVPRTLAEPSAFDRGSPHWHS